MGRNGTLIHFRSDVAKLEKSTQTDRDIEGSFLLDVISWVKYNSLQNQEYTEDYKSYFPFYVKQGAVL